MLAISTEQADIRRRSKCHLIQRDPVKYMTCCCSSAEFLYRVGGRLEREYTSFASDVLRDGDREHAPVRPDVHEDATVRQGIEENGLQTSILFIPIDRCRDILRIGRPIGLHGREYVRRPWRSRRRTRAPRGSSAFSSPRSWLHRRTTSTLVVLPEPVMARPYTTSSLMQ